MFLKIFIEFIKNLLTPLILSYLLNFTAMQSALVVLGAFLIDIDHLIYIRFNEGITSFSKTVKWVKTEYNKLDPHLYVFHTAEFLVVLSLVTFYISRDFLFYITLGFIINTSIDMIGYFKIYKNLKPWIKYYSLIYYFIFRTEK